MSLHHKTPIVADGRRQAARAIVLQSMSSLPCFAFAKSIINDPNSAFDRRVDETWGGLGVASDAEEHAFDYEPLGHAMMTMERFMGGMLHDADASVVADEVMVMGLVEPYDHTLTGRDRLINVPDWTLKKGDLLCILLAADHYIYLECVGRLAQSIMTDFGVKYVFNQKHDLDFLDALDKDNIADISPLD